MGTQTKDLDRLREEAKLAIHANFAQRQRELDKALELSKKVQQGLEAAIGPLPKQ